MEHWFDGLVRRVAGDGVSRRGFLSRGVSTGLVAAGASLPAATALARLSDDQPAPTGRGGHIRMAQQPAARRIGSCTFGRSGRAATTQFSLTHDDLTLRLEAGFDASGRTHTARIVVTQGGEAVVTIDGNVALSPNGAPGATTVNMTYGSAFAGIRQARFTTTDRRTFHGTIDGRELQPISGGANFRSAEVKFRDGQAVAQLAGPAGLDSKLAGLQERATRELPGCKPSRRGDLGVPPYTKLASAASFNRLMGQPPRDDVIRVGVNPDLCSYCNDDCFVDELLCCARSLASIAFPPAAALAYAGCLLDAGYCAERCQAPGHACCPVSCSGMLGNIIDGQCCGNGETCYKPLGVNSESFKKYGYCCPAGQLTCRQECCEPGYTSCTPDGFCGCKGDLQQCGVGATAACCNRAAGQQCFNGQCCHSSQAVNGSCCPPNQYNCAGKCCPPLEKCCNGKCCSGDCCNNVCCPQGTQCSGGRCCPTAQVCGGACCAGGQVCLDASTSRCGTGSARQCPPHNYFCRSMNSAGVFVSVCCPEGATCCQGKCCQPARRLGTHRFPAEVCCQNSGAGRTDCWPPTSCGPR